MSQTPQKKDEFLQYQIDQLNKSIQLILEESGIVHVLDKTISNLKIECEQVKTDVNFLKKILYSGIGLILVAVGGAILHLVIITH